MATKTYKIKQMSRSMLIYVNESPRRVEFYGGSKWNGGCGQFTTADESLQKAIEMDHRFGNIATHEIYLDGIFGEETAVAPEAVQEVVETNEAPAPTKSTFQEAKQLLIEKYGVTPDEVKNFPQVKKKIKELGLSIEL
jgi:hypothetical protein